MKNTVNALENTFKDLNRSYISEKDKRKLSRSIASAFAAFVFFGAGYIYGRIFPAQTIVSELIYLVSVSIIGIPIFITAVKGFIKKDMSAAMEILVSIAIIVAVLDGQFVTAVLIPIILTVVHFFEEKSIMGGRDAIEGLKRMQADTAILFSDGEEKIVDAKSLKEGDIIIVKPGMALPIDGTVIKGETNIDQKSLTGESLPKHGVVNDKVYAGTTNIDGLLEVKVDKAYVDTSFSRIVQLLENAENMTLPEAKLVDRFMLYYIPIVILIATLVWLFSKDISKAVAILVVSCPCGYMLVSSAPVIAALGSASKRGVLIKNPSFIEKLADSDSVMFDKTGTITGGTLEAAEIKLVDAENEEELIRAAASVAHGSLHPTSKSIIKLCKTEDFDREYIITEHPGNGVTGKKDNSEIILGSLRFVRSFGYCTQDNETEQNGSSTWIVKDDRVLGCIVFQDVLRDDVDDAFDSLRKLGFKRISILTGDNKAEAEKIASETTADITYSELLPEQKLEKVKEEKQDHTVVVAGDGINDSLALNEADVGIAMGAMGSDTAIQSADVSFMNNSLLNLPFIVLLARKTKAVVYQNMIIAFITSFIMIFLAAGGVVTPLMGAFFHNIGAFIVLLNSARVIREKYVIPTEQTQESAETE